MVRGWSGSWIVTGSWAGVHSLRLHAAPLLLSPATPRPPRPPPGAYYVAPSLFKTTVRPIVSDQRHNFYQRIPVAGCAAAALAIAFCQCLVYQVCLAGWLGWTGRRGACRVQA